MEERAIDPGFGRREFLAIAAAATTGMAFTGSRRVLGEESTTKPGGAASAPALNPPPGTVIGRTLYDGEPPVPEPIDCSADPQCAQLYRKEPLTREVLLVDKQHRLQNVFVSVVNGLPKDRKWPVPEKPVVLDQKGCLYIPHVFAVRAGQPLEIINSSKIHEVPHGRPKINPEFSFSLPKRGMKKTLVLTEPEAFKIKCDVHPWETAWCHVMSHPFHSVSDAEGRFMIGGLAPGEYQLEFRHEHWTMVTQTMTIRVDADKPLRLDDVKFTPVEDDERDRHRPRRAASKPAG